MIPRVIVHNSISIDGSLTNFEADEQLHYRIATLYRPEVHLIGSNSMRIGIETYWNGIPQEEENDYVKQKRDPNLPYWVIVDSKGALNGLLHICRRFELCKDVIVLVSEKSPGEYLAYLKERDYDYLTVGVERVDLRSALKSLAQAYRVDTVVTDTGKILGNLLLNQGLVSEISLLVHPVIVGNRSYNMFGDITANKKVKLVKNEILEGGFLWTVYGVAEKEK